MAAEEKEAFLSRWSRRKQAQERATPDAPARADDAAAPELPPVEELTPQSDFAPFMHPKVGDALRRVALKKLFGDPHFNAPDLFEPFSGDWTGGDPISDELLKTLNQARTVLYREEEEQKKKDEDARRRADTELQAHKDGDGSARQDA
jgi:hypothetical protein